MTGGRCWNTGTLPTSATFRRLVLVVTNARAASPAAALSPVRTATTISGSPRSLNPVRATATPPSLRNSASTSGDTSSASSASSRFAFNSGIDFAPPFWASMNGTLSSSGVPLNMAASCGPSSGVLCSSA